MTVSVRNLGAEDVPASARLHAEVLHMEFLARCGEPFLRSYHRAWISSTDGAALGAYDESGKLVGVLLGALDPEAHFRSMLRRSGLTLGFWFVVRAVSHPAFARELVTTRGVRYVRGLTRVGLGALRSRVRGRATEPDDSGASAGSAASGGSRAPVSSADAKSGGVGEVTHVMVDPATQGKGVGRALLEQAASLGHAAHLDELVLVTPPDLAAADFYDHLGWRRDGSLTSRSGESFVRFILRLNE